MSEIRDDKSQARAMMRRRLGELGVEAAHALSMSTCERLMSADFFRSANTVMLYLPVAGELDISPLALRCFQLGKTVCAPRIDWERKKMIPVEIHDFNDSFEIRKHGIREPAESGPSPAGEIDLIVVPGLAFDLAGGRLGRGGGFYDRFLTCGKLRRDVIRCGVCFDSQVMEKVPSEAHDIQLDAIATDRRLIHVSCPDPA